MISTIRTTPITLRVRHVELMATKEYQTMLIIPTKLSPDTTILPHYAKTGDAGLDLTATKVTIENDLLVCHTGLSLAIPYGYVGLLYSRSSISKYPLQLANGVGVIDSGYRGEIVIKFRLLTPDVDCDMLYKSGDRVAQLVILPYPQVQLAPVTELSDSQRGEGGFGSTGV
jgi:dUTP pyrophosphatase